MQKRKTKPVKGSTVLFIRSDGTHEVLDKIEEDCDGEELIEALEAANMGHELLREFKQYFKEKNQDGRIVTTISPPEHLTDDTAILHIAAIRVDSSDTRTKEEILQESIRRMRQQE